MNERERRKAEAKVDKNGIAGRGEGIGKFDEGKKDAKGEENKRRKRE
jgi:hypothetical protein